MTEQTEILRAYDIAGLIRSLRGHRVILDSDLAKLYGVQTFRLNEAVKRNRERFPADFLFQVTAEERDFFTSQIAISKAQISFHVKEDAVPYRVKRRSPRP